MLVLCKASAVGLWLFAKVSKYGCLFGEFSVGNSWEQHKSLQRAVSLKLARAFKLLHSVPCKRKLAVNKGQMRLLTVNVAIQHAQLPIAAHLPAVVVPQCPQSLQYTHP